MVNFFYISFMIVFIIDKCNGNILKSKQDNIKPVFNNDHNQYFKENLTSSQCETSLDQINCSLVITEPVQFSAGFSFKYIRSARPEIYFIFFLNDHKANGTFSVANPPKECLLPFKYADVCVKLNNFAPNIPECISGCVVMEFKLIPFKAKLDLGHFIIPLKKNYDREQCGSSNRSAMSPALIVISLILTLRSIQRFFKID